MNKQYLAFNPSQIPTPEDALMLAFGRLLGGFVIFIEKYNEDVHFTEYKVNDKKPIAPSNTYVYEVITDRNGETSLKYVDSK